MKKERTCLLCGEKLENNQAQGAGLEQFKRCCCYDCVLALQQPDVRRESNVRYGRIES